MNHRSLFFAAIGASVLLVGATAGGCANPLDPAGSEPLGHAASALGGGVVINEIESSGGTPGDWVELYNASAAAIDISGYKLLDNDDLHTPYVIPAGTTLAAGAFFVID